MRANKNRKVLMGSIIILVAIVALILFLVFGTAGGKRWQKNLESSLNDGLNREILVYNADGSVIYSETGKFDISYGDGRLEYIDADTGLKTNIYIGYNATVIVNELE
ncbi:hypothetical protein [Enterococcus sp. HY326]|uniref:hypothetical protein n=1 Tax=Enterococcus sp. HY326 TaxID=2971265 RepID=UPI00224005DC|nr:hypothetical protein [Enterococcus sp. HY326]